MKAAKGLRARHSVSSHSHTKWLADREMMVCVNKEQGDSHAAARAQTCVTNSFIWYVSNRCRRRCRRFIPPERGPESLCTAHMHALFYYCRRTHWCSRHDDLSIYKLFNKLKKRAVPVTMTLSMGNKALVSQAVVCSEINMLTPPRPKGGWERELVTSPTAAVILTLLYTNWSTAEFAFKMINLPVPQSATAINKKNVWINIGAGNIFLFQGFIIFNIKKLMNAGGKYYAMCFIVISISHDS